jgi:hypothetical protein
MSEAGVGEADGLDLAEVGRSVLRPARACGDSQRTARQLPTSLVLN